MHKGFYIIYLFLLVFVQDINSCQIDYDQGDDYQNEISYICTEGDYQLDCQLSIDEAEEDSCDSDFLFLFNYFFSGKQIKRLVCQCDILYFSRYLYFFTDSSPPFQA